MASYYKSISEKTKRATRLLCTIESMLLLEARLGPCFFFFVLLVLLFLVDAIYLQRVKIKVVFER